MRRIVGWALGLILALFAGVAAGAMLGRNDPASAGTTLVTADPGSSIATTNTAEPAPDTTSPATPTRPNECGLPAGQPFVGGPSAQIQTIGEMDGVVVEAVVYPRPDYEGQPWTQWGQGVFHQGRFYSAIGDHIGVDGNSVVYEFDPATGTLSTVGDVLSYVDHEPGSWGYGKIHGQMVPGSCGELYFATYWGSSNGLGFSGSYQGDLMFRLDPATRTITNLGPPVIEHGIPSLAASPDGRLVYGEALDPLLAEEDVDQGPFFAYDTMSEEVVFEGPSEPHEGFRNVMVDRDGRAFYSTGAGGLAVFDPLTNAVSALEASMPGEWLRASTKPTPDGRIFGVTDEEDALFVLHPSGEIESLGTLRGYTTSMALNAEGTGFFYVPEAHGGTWELNAPLISVDGDTGEESVVVELNQMAEDQLGLRLGGTYGLAVDPGGQVVYIGMNAGPLGADDGFGEVVLVVVRLP